MNSVAPYINDLKKKITILLSSYQNQKEKNSILINDNNDLLEKVNHLETEMQALKKRIEILDMAKGISVKDDNSMNFARGRVNSLIRQIDKCISLLNE